MQKLLKTLGKSVICLSVIAMTGACFGADSPRGNAAVSNGRATATTQQTHGRSAASSGRMPSIPVLPISALGNKSTSTNTNHNQTPEPEPEPEPGPTPPPPPPPGPEPDPDTPVECPDGGVRNSAYTVDNCMDEILSCVNGGALPNGINSLFNQDLRESIINGMSLCLTQVEKCISTVRKDCHYVYASASDVWLDFNARKVQPEYYRFVLAQTGLTPTQAENTCLLLDRNTYGASFDAVSTTDRTSSEYLHTVGAYNSAHNDSMYKANPLGAQVNHFGIDGKRGYYARWDAEKAECLLRVAAYNKETPIRNSWLFGIVGNDDPAEVWQAAGSTFTCNKDLFGFSLMNKTKTAAVVGIGGGTLVGAGIGALAGHGDRKFDCSIKSMRDELLKQIQDNQKTGILNQFLETQISTNDKTLTQAQCNEIIDLYDLWQMGKDAVKTCESKNQVIVEINAEFDIDIISRSIRSQCSSGGACLSDAQVDQIVAAVQAPFRELAQQYASQIQDALEYCTFRALNLARRDGTGVYCKGHNNECISRADFQAELATLTKVFASLEILNGQESNRLKTTLVGAGIGAAAGGTATAITAFVERNNINCRVADGLSKVGFGKSYTIDRLRDFYVKWALKLPENVAPTAVVTNCENWGLTCALYTDLDECRAAQFNYRPGNLASTTLVKNACMVSGSACIANVSVAQANGECMTNPNVPPTPSQTPNVKTCDEWRDACAALVNPAECNVAKVIYTPRSMQVSTACQYNQQSHKCKVNYQKAKLYLDTSTCTEVDQVDPNQPDDR